MKNGLSYRDLLVLGDKHSKGKRFVDAISCFEQAHELKPSAPAPLHNLAKLYAELHDYEKAESLYREALSFQVTQSTARRLSEVLMLSGKLHEALEQAMIINNLTNGEHENDAIRLSNIYSYIGNETESERALIEYALKTATPLHKDAHDATTILVAALPKSASTSLSYTLASALSLEVAEYPCRRCRMLFNATHLIAEIFLKKLCQGKVIHSHVVPEPANLSILEKFGLKLVLHVRDPRDCLLSVHRMILKGQGPQFLLREPDFLDWDESKQIDWLIDNYLPFQMKWIDGWLAATDKIKTPFFISSFEQMVKDGMRPLISTIANALDLEIKPDFEEHTRRFREGKTGSWKTVFNEQQIEIANRYIQGFLKERFGWD